MKHFILINDTIKRVDEKTFSSWFSKKENRLIEKTNVIAENDKEYVSTIFLGCQIHKNAPLFESMVFGGKYDGQSWQYLTFDEAKRGHHAMLEAVRNEDQHKLDTYPSHQESQ